MADIRIKDLTTTASSTASDDFIAVDGTTNGTRKLNAFSPTFGGNATVTGTLTTNGGVIIPAAGSISTLTSTNATHVANATWGALSQGYGTTADWSVFNKSQGTVMYVPTGTSNLFLYGKIDANTLSVYSTTASTSTSTGALVVGNGTSGGLGVGGALNVGGQIRAQLGLFAGSPPTGLASAYQVDVDAGTSRDILSWGDSSRVGLIRGEQDGSGRATLKFGRYTASTFAEYFRVTGLAATDAIVNIYGTTASTSTSSGALVVSGGVGVAGAVNAGTFYGLVDGVTAPATESGYARIYVDSADGDLKVKFGDGTVKTIATDS